jgi:hypothetical protein
MIRTQVYLTQAERKKLHVMAHRTGKSQSELIRDAIDHFLENNVVNKQNKLAVMQSVKGLWEQRTDLPDFIALRKEFDR